MTAAPQVVDEATFEQRLIEHEKPLIAPLDHPAGIFMVVDSRLERDMRAHACAKEPETVEWLERVLGGATDACLYDVGACSGAYSLLAAKLRAKVVAFEPSSQNFRQLTRNDNLNRAGIVCLPVALGRTTHLDTLSLSSDLAGAASHALVGAAPITFGHSVLVWALDALLATFRDLPYPTAMKIDTDGNEHDVLMGAHDLLRRPALTSVMVETRSATRDQIANLLTSAGFEEVGDHRRIAPDTWNVEWTRTS